MDPVAALRRIAFLLERDRAPTYRVRAFRTAADLIQALPAGEVERRASAGTLTRLKGIGDTTAGVIEAAVRGETPAYLADLEASVEPLPTGGDTLRRELRGDLHAHTTDSDGGSPIAEMAAAAMDLGHAYLAITDHSPRLTVARGLSAERLADQIDTIDAWNTQSGNGFRLLTGIECDILVDGGLDQTGELLGRLDVVVASVHSDLRAESRAMTARMLTAVANPHTDILGHCTGRLITGGRGTRPPSRFDADAVFAACAEREVAVEINSRPERLDPPKALLAKAVAAGCLFSIDTDAHAPGQLEWQANGCERALECGVDPDRVVNTWALPRLREWLARNG